VTPAGLTKDRLDKKLRVVVIDDELLERRRLVNYLGQAPGVEVVGTLSGDRDSVEAVRRLAPDLILLDVRLQACSGFELVEALGPDALPKVVFVTREREHAVRAFEVGALDYIIKPVDPDRLETAIARVRAAFEVGLDEQAKGLFTRLERLVRPRARAGENYLERFPVKEGGRVYFVKTSAIDWIESADNYVRLHTGVTSHLVRKSLSQVSAELDPSRFVRIHRRAIVNLDRVREIQPGIGRYRLVVLENGAQLRLSERYYRQLQQLRGSAGSGRSLSGRRARRY